MKWLALVILLLTVSPALAGTIHIFGTNVSNANQNVTKDSTNASVTVTAWTEGTGTKTIAVKGYNASESLTFVLYNFTATMVIERKENSTSKNSSQANSTGAITFTVTQNAGNISYSFTPAVNYGGYNMTWLQLWTYPYIGGTNLSIIITDLITGYGYLPLTGTTSDLDMNNKNITNVQTLNVTTTNVTRLNATDVIGNGSGLYALNGSNLTDTIPSGRYGTGVFVANLSDFESNISGRGYITSTLANLSFNNSIVGLASVYNATNLTINGGWLTLMNWTEEAYDPNNEFANSNYTAPLTGTYHISTNVIIQKAVSAGTLSTKVFVNNIDTYDAYAGAVAGIPVSVSIDRDIRLNANDVVSIYVQTDTANTATVWNGARFSFMTIYMVRRG